jgi:hypothetical protein
VLTDENGNVVPTSNPCGLTLVFPSAICYGPADLQSAYSIPQVPSTATVAIVDAFDNPNAESDLAVYRSTYGLPPCTSANGCFTKVGQTGSTTALPTTDMGWGTEIDLDIQMASAACPTCKILLVEASSATLADLGASVDMAVSLGATVVSNSYTGGEDPSQLSDMSFNHPGVGIFASSGDFAFGTGYPATSPFVTSVGGTSLLPSTSDPRGWTETVWDFESYPFAFEGGGSGCSQFQPKPTWQTDTGCTSRMVADVSAVADPATGVAIYDTFEQPGRAGWFVEGGTSVASPVVAAIYAVTGNGRANGSLSYHAFPNAFHDVTFGTNSRVFGCSPPYFCDAEPGYDGPTGNGTPNGTVLAAMSAARPLRVPWNERADFNGDGRADTITTSGGLAFVHEGSASGISRAPEITLANPWFGSTLCGKNIAINLGDIDADGFSDLALVGCTGVGAPGVLHVHRGSAQGIQWLADWETMTRMPVTNPANVFATGVGDVNGDGQSDVLAGETGTSAARVFFSASGRGAAIAAPAGSVGFGTTAGPVGDVNGDSIDDFVITDAAFAYLYLGSSNASTPPTAPATVISCSGACALGGSGDVNGDGLSDFVLASGLFLGQRTSGGVSPTALPIPSGTVVAVADFTSDGHADAVISSPGAGPATVSLYAGGPSGISPTPSAVLVSPSAGGLSTALAPVGDFNGDDQLDAAFWGVGVRRLIAFFGTGSGLATTAAENLLPDGHWNLEQDFNGDGNADFTRVSGGTVEILPGSSSGLRAATILSTSAPVSGETSFGKVVSNLGDINGDGITDLGVVGTISPSNVVQTFLGDAWGISTTPAQTITSPTPGSLFGTALAGVGDINGDGWADVVITDPAVGTAYVYTGNPGGALISAGSVVAPGGASGFGSFAGGVGDVNGDGFDDFVISGSASAYLYLGRLSGPFAAPTALPCGGCRVGGFGDVNADGLSDFVLGMALYFGQPSGGGVMPTTASVPAAGAYAVADFNGDGFSDIIVGRTDGSAVSWYAGGVAGFGSSPVSTLTTPTGSGVVFGFPFLSDINGDGWLDVPLSTGNLSQESGRVFVYPGTSAGPSTHSNAGITPGLPWNLRPDFNDDGYADLVVSDASGVQVFNGSAAGLPAAPSMNLPPSVFEASLCGDARTSAFNAGDVNGDGIPDLAVFTCSLSATNSGIFVTAFTGGTGGLEPLAAHAEHILGSQNFQGAFAMAVGDVNGDGAADVLGGIPARSTAYVWQGEALEPLGGRAQLPAPSGSSGFPVAGGPVGDVNGDGFADFVVTDAQNAYLYLGLSALQSGAGASLSPVTSVPCGGPCQLGGYGDVNGDGLSDFTLSGNLYEGQMTSPWIRSPIPLGSSGPVVLADLNFDGAFDALFGPSLGSPDSAVSVFLSGGATGLPSAPSFSLSSPDPAGSGFGQIVSVLGDVNGDGSLDSVVWATAANKVHLYTGTLSGFSSTPAQSYLYDPNMGLAPLH